MKLKAGLVLLVVLVSAVNVLGPTPSSRGRHKFVGLKFQEAVKPMPRPKA
jgi:hypothetical protein